MITKYKVYEKLGYSDEVGIITDFIWNKYKDFDYNSKKDFVIDLSELTKDMSIKINKLKIEPVRDESFRMQALFLGKDYELNKNVVIKQSMKFKKIKSVLEHEIKHIYRYIKIGSESRNIDYFQGMSGELPFYQDLVLAMYAADPEEIQSFYQQDIRYYKEKSGRFRNFKYFLRGCNLNTWYSILKKFDIDNYKKQTKEDNILVMNIYNEIKDEVGLRLKYKNKDIISNIKNIFKSPKDIKSIINRYKFDYDVKYTDEQIDRFYNQLKKDIERAKKLYLNYFGKLYAYFH